MGPIGADCIGGGSRKDTHQGFSPPKAYFKKRAYKFFNIFVPGQLHVGNCGCPWVIHRRVFSATDLQTIKL